jgi:hypothetical protein
MATDQATEKGQKVFLNPDPPVRGQRFACISFLSPEDIILSREQFFLHRFLTTVGADTVEMLDNLAKQHADNPTELASIRMLKDKYAYLQDARELQAFYNTFCAENSSALESEFVVHNGGLTSLRALKIRGVYDSIDEARDRCKELRSFDKGLFNIYVAQVGCWLPWSPNPDEISDSVYADNQLNMLMNRYKENCKLRDEMYSHRKDTLLSGDDADASGAGPSGVGDDHGTLFDAGPIITESGKVL